VRKENRPGSLEKSKEKKFVSNRGWGEKLTGVWRKLHNVELRNFWSSQTTTVAVAFRVKHVAEVIYTCKILVGISEGKRRGKVKVKWNLVQALRPCTGRTAHRVSRGIALLFFDQGTRRG
jgi:hypothetical protein